MEKKYSKKKNTRRETNSSPGKDDGEFDRKLTVDTK